MERPHRPERRNHDRRREEVSQYEDQPNCRTSNSEQAGEIRMPPGNMQTTNVGNPSGLINGRSTSGSVTQPVANGYQTVTSCPPPDYNDVCGEQNISSEQSKLINQFLKVTGSQDDTFASDILAGELSAVILLFRLLVFILATYCR